jgi:AbrB family looped-hinge helix DNA binding protein
MQVTMSSKGQIVIPAEIRRRFGFKPGQKFDFMEFAGKLYLLEVPDDPIAAARGAFAAPGVSGTKALEDSRHEEIEKEDEEFREWERRQRS